MAEEPSPRDIFEVQVADGIHTLLLRGTTPRPLLSFNAIEIEHFLQDVDHAIAAPATSSVGAVGREGHVIALVEVKPKKLWRTNLLPFRVYIESPKGLCLFEFTLSEMKEFRRLFDTP